jgi:signal transduction histidine kinase
MAILIVDDETPIRRVLRRVLETHHAVDEAATLDEARRKLEAGGIDLILCDIDLSGESGFDLVRGLAGTPAGPAFVMVTGIDDPRVAKEALEMGASGYLVKPFTPNEVRITVESALRRRELEHARRRMEERERELRLVSDRERIGRDLHDTVIQRLFATSLLLQSACARIDDQPARARVERAIEQLDVTIHQIRTVIFDIEGRDADRPSTVRASVVELTREITAAVGCDPRIAFRGPVDASIGPELVEDLLATLRASLSNVVRHASATEVRVEVEVALDVVALRVIDDGVGVDGADGAGIAGMRATAERRGGALTVGRRPSGGTEVEWRVPVARPTA